MKIMFLYLLVFTMYEYQSLGFAGPGVKLVIVGSPVLGQKIFDGLFFSKPTKTSN